MMTIPTERVVVYGEIPRDKVTLAGNCGVGKTTLLMWFKTGKFVDVQKRGHYDGEFHKEWNAGEDRVTMTLFDTAGMECGNHRPSIATIYFRRSKATLLVYDISSQESFDGLVKWENEANEKTGTRIAQDQITVLIGNKIDLEDERKVSRQRALQFADNHAIPKEFIFEVSAKTGQGVKEMFNDIAKAVNCIPNRPTVQPTRPPSCSKC